MSWRPPRSSVSTTPSHMILLSPESAPHIYVDSANDGEAVRLRDWFDRQPELCELLDCAIEIRAEWLRKEAA
jgi:hypothetical protein